MAIIPIRALGDPVLREPGRDVEAFDDSLRRLVQDMIETMYDAPGVGLAGEQVGRALRVFVYDDGDGSGPRTVVNPVLSQLDGEQIEEEGCLSIRGLYWPTKRAMRVRLDGVDLDGSPVTRYGEGLTARIFQHETDHLAGTLYIDRLDPQERRDALAEFRRLELDPGSRRSRPAG
ncbi:MAG TPA: peptide deformylase [Actinomycetota bacterium]